MALTDTAIRGLKPKERAFQVADGGGLVLEVMPGGGKVWRLRYRVRGKAEKVTIGPYPAISLAKARLRRAEAKVKIVEGGSPARDKQTQKRAEREADLADDSVGSFARHWLTEFAEKANKDPRNIRRYVEKEVIPALGSKKLADVSPADVLAPCDKIKKRGADQSALAVRRKSWSTKAAISIPSARIATLSVECEIGRCRLERLGST